MKRLLLTAIILGVFCAGAFAGDADDNAFLQKVDDKLNAFSNIHMTLKLIVVSPTGEEKVREIKSWQKGEMRMTKFLKPSSDRGMAALSTDKVNSFIYFPASKKIRRIAAHVRNQTFLGTELSYEDMSTTRYLDDYDAEIIGETDTHTTLKLTPKPGSKASYGHIEFMVLKERLTVEKIEYFDKTGKKIKIEERSDWEFYQDKYWNMTKIVVTNTVTGGKTVMELRDTQFDLDLSKDTFTQRNLKRPVR